MKICPQCSERLGDNADACPFCGHRFPIAHSYSIQTCPNCHEQVSAQARNCPHCGHALRGAGASRTAVVNDHHSSKSDAWSGWTLFLLFALTLFIPIVGIVVGAMNMSNRDRKDQAKILLVFGLFATLFSALAFLGL